MADVESGQFTIGVFPDVAWARTGLAALRRAGFAVESLSIVGKDEPAVAALIDAVFTTAAEPLALPGLGPVLIRGPLVAALQGSDHALDRLGLANTLRRVGFQPHDARIYEMLTARGGVLVAVHSEPRAADALAVLMSHGGGNAAIGAWSGRI